MDLFVGLFTKEVYPASKPASQPATPPHVANLLKHSSDCGHSCLYWMTGFQDPMSVPNAMFVLTTAFRRTTPLHAIIAMIMWVFVQIAVSGFTMVRLKIGMV
jgi:hypothetical protein